MRSNTTCNFLTGEVKQEISSTLQSSTGLNQLAYKKGYNTTMALLKCQHYQLNWLDKDADIVKVYSFDFSKAFDFVSHQILCNKLKLYNINPYVVNRMINFLSNRKLRVVVDGVTTKLVEIDGGVRQRTILDPVLFSIMVNDINVVNPETNLLIKFADDITQSIPVGPNLPDDLSVSEIQNIKLWSNMNRLKLNLTKTWELVMRGQTPKNPPGTVPVIDRKSELKLLGVTSHENPCN